MFQGIGLKPGVRLAVAAQGPPGLHVPHGSHEVTEPGVRASGSFTVWIDFQDPFFFLFFTVFQAFVMCSRLCCGCVVLFFLTR